MKATIILKRICLIMVLCACVCARARAQTFKVVKNFPGVLAGIEWNTISGSGGLEYERFLYTRDKFAIGGKVAYIAKYDYGNMEILSSSCCESASHVLIVATGSYYTGQKKNFSGFFVYTGLGVGISELRYDNPGVENKRTMVRPALELGPGWQFSIGNSMALRGKISASFGPFKGGFTSTSVSFGF